MHTCDRKNHHKLDNCESLSNEGQIEVKREPMRYTMQSIERREKEVSVIN